jgi:type II secretory pathway pseudopilin PulG
MENRSNCGDLKLNWVAEHALERGFTYLGVLLAIALMGVSLLAISEVWTQVAERQKLAQLDWVGQQYVQAIESYYYSNTGSVHFYPERLDDLLEDKRYLSVKRHIRTLYPDPFTGTLSWTPITSPTGGIQGVETTVSNIDHGFRRTYAFVSKQ